MEVHARAAGRLRVQPSADSVGVQERGRLQDRAGTVEERGATVGRQEEQPDHDLRQTLALATVT